MRNLIKCMKVECLPEVPDVLRCITGEDCRWICGSAGGSRISRYLDTIRTDMK